MIEGYSSKITQAPGLARTLQKGGYKNRYDIIPHPVALQ